MYTITLSNLEAQTLGLHPQEGPTCFQNSVIAAYALFCKNNFIRTRLKFGQKLRTM